MQVIVKIARFMVTVRVSVFDKKGPAPAHSRDMGHFEGRVGVLANLQKCQSKFQWTHLCCRTWSFELSFEIKSGSSISGQNMGHFVKRCFLLWEWGVSFWKKGAGLRHFQRQGDKVQWNKSTYFRPRCGFWLLFGPGNCVWGQNCGHFFKTWILWKEWRSPFFIKEGRCLDPFRNQGTNVSGTQSCPGPRRTMWSWFNTGQHNRPCRIWRRRTPGPVGPVMLTL